MPELQRQWFRRGVRAIRGVVSIACLLACVGFAALWVRSYSWHDTIFKLDPGRYWEVASWQGKLAVDISTTRGVRASEIRLFCMPADEWREMFRRITIGATALPEPDIMGFGWQTSRYDVRASAPHWFAVVVAGALAVALKPKPRLRFTIRDLLVAMTMIAVVVAALASLPRHY
jgi:hypothetical protein